MRYIRPYSLFENISRKSLDTYLGSKDYTIQNDIVSCYGDMYVDSSKNYKLPCVFGNIGGNFSAFDIELHDITGFPKTVNGNVDLKRNQIKNIDILKDSKISGGLSLEDNLITHIDITINCEKLYVTGNPLTYITYANYDKIEFFDTPLYEFYVIIEERFMDIDDNIHITDKEFLDRIDEFEIIKDYNKIDILNLQRMFDLYEIYFKKDTIIKQIEEISYYHIINI